MKKGKFITILCFMFILLLCPFSIFAEDSELGEVIIQTDGTYHDHEFITACEVGSIVELDIGSFDTAYLNNDFSTNIAINHKVSFTCQETNDLKLAFYGTNLTIFNELSGLTSQQYDYLNNFDFDSYSDLLMYTLVDGFVYISTNILSYDSSTGIANCTDFIYVASDGTVTTYSPESSSVNINQSNRPVFYFKMNGSVYHDGIEYVNINASADPSGSATFTGTGRFIKGSSVSLTAVPVSIYSFLQWSDGSNSNPYTFIANDNVDLTAFLVVPDSLDNLVYKITTYTDPIIIFEPFDSSENVTTYTYMYYTINTTYYGNKLNIYSLTNDGYALIQSGIDSYSVTSSGSKKNSCASIYAPCTPPTLPSTTTEISSSFGSGNFVITASVPEGVIEVYNPSSDALISDGNNTSQNATDKNEQQNAELDSVINEYNEIEGQFKDNLDTSLNDIDFAFDFGNITDFSTSANFVRAQFDNLTNNPFGSLVGFSLAVGLALLIMGRRL